MGWSSISETLILCHKEVSAYNRRDRIPSAHQGYNSRNKGLLHRSQMATEPYSSTVEAFSHNATRQAAAKHGKQQTSARTLGGSHHLIFWRSQKVQNISLRQALLNAPPYYIYAARNLRGRRADTRGRLQMYIKNCHGPISTPFKAIRKRPRSATSATSVSTACCVLGGATISRARLLPLFKRGRISQTSYLSYFWAVIPIPLRLDI